MRKERVGTYCYRSSANTLCSDSGNPTVVAMHYQRAVIAPSRERLLEAAKALFAERGYEASSTATICRLAGTSESQLIKHFRSKQGILEAIFEYAW